MKRLACLMFLGLSACLTMPKPHDPVLVVRLQGAITLFGGTCGVKGYRTEWRSDSGGMIYLRDRHKPGYQPFVVTRYVVDCGHETAYFVELAESEAIEPWAMKCDHHTQALLGGGCTVLHLN